MSTLPRVAIYIIKTVAVTANGARIAPMDETVASRPGWWRRRRGTSRLAVTDRGPYDTIAR
jgi:hypothetical protein